ncbi:cyanophycinase [Rivibacter subsaxonicus]|nr:cyanophycinase [Rivibacter subsaxonicus]
MQVVNHRDDIDTLPRLTRRGAFRLAAGALGGALGTGARAQGSATATSQPGIVVPIGGALKFDNAEVWARLVQLSGGPGARWLVLPTAGDSPQRAGERIAQTLEQAGAKATVLPVSPRWPGTEVARAVRDPALVAEVAQAAGVYFAGGAQERIVDALQPGGQSTPLLDAIRALKARGGIVAGSSAGAAVMSRTMFRDAQDSLAVLKFGARMGKEIDRGLGFVGDELFVDQHFLKRGRIGRLLPVMWQEGFKLGLGVEENSGAIVRGSQIEAIGAKGALLVDLRGASHDASLGAFNLKGVRLTYLDRGDRHDLGTGTTTPSEIKQRDAAIDPNSAAFKPYFPRAPFYGDMLGDNTIVNAMGNLIDNRESEAFGLAFDGRALRPGAPAQPPEARATLGFEFRLYRGPDSRGWFTGAFGGEDYTAVNLYLDVTPVEMAKPLFRPLAAAGR